MKRTLLFFPIILFVAFSVSASSTNAVYWDFYTMASPTLNPFSGLSVSDVARNNGGGGNPLTTMSGSSGYTTASGFAASGGTNMVASAVLGGLNLSSSTFFSTTLSWDLSLSYSLAITNVSLGSRSTGTGPTTLSLYGSTDGFSSDFESLGDLGVSTNFAWAAEDFANLFININPGETYSLRLYGYGGTGGTSNWRIDDLAIALTPTPEPSSIALAALGGLICVGFLRRRVF
jgi:hypothetical protein